MRPDVPQSNVSGRALTLKVAVGAGPVRTGNLDSSNLTLRSGESLQVIAVEELRTSVVLSKS